LEPFVFGVESAVLLLEGGEVALSGKLDFPTDGERSETVP
jgi:hypothetical protein